MRLIVLVFCILFSVMDSYGQYIWRDTIVGFGIKPDIAVADGKKYIAYLSETNPGFVKCATVEDSEIESKTVAIGYFYGPLDIQIDQDKAPRIVYHDHNSEDLGHATLVLGIWQVDRIENDGHDGWDGSLYIDDQNISHVVSIDPNSGVEYAYQSGETWIWENIDHRNTDYKFGTSITNNGGTLGVAYYISSINELVFAYKSGDEWLHEIIAQDAIFPSLSIDNDGNFSIAYYQQEGSAGHIAFAQRINGEWIAEKVYDLNDIEVTFSGARKIVDLELINNEFHLSFSNKKSVWHGSRTNGRWNILKAFELENSDDDLGQQTSLDFTDSGLPVIAFYQRSRSLQGGGAIHLLEAISEDTTQNANDDVLLTVKTAQDEDIENVTLSIRDENQNELAQLDNISSLKLSDLPSNSRYICPMRTDSPQSNLSAIDLVRMSKIVLSGVSPCKTDFIAADVNQSGTVSAIDIVQTLNLIIGKSDAFADGKSWRFYKSSIDIDNLSLSDIYDNQCITVDEAQTQGEIKFSGVKLGDIICNP